MHSFSKQYQPAEVENHWYTQWITHEAFKADIDAHKEPFCIMIPPPNVTGVLTMGHVLNNTLQDVLVRRARQFGKSVLWLPGTDHAGIATQTRVEREMAKEGLKKEDLGREAFLEKVAQWRDEHGGIIIDQLKRLGTSCDWSRLVHTLDADYSHGVLTAFVKLYEFGYVYRGKRMINWCPKSQTALSDEEVMSKPEKSFLYKVRYELVEFPGEYLTVATQRPETIPADTALAVNPEDDRYQKYIGCHVWRPFVKASLPIIVDAAVEKEFGTGVLKVTPAHAMIDFEIGERHGLPMVDIIDAKGILNEQAGPVLAGLERFKAREKAVEHLESIGLLVEKVPYETQIPYSERGNVPVEPRLSEQWFLRYPRVEEAKAVVREGLIQFHPERWTKTYLHWLDNIKDWCISRQIWWGHRIPVWYKKGCDRQNPQHWHVSVEGPKDPENWEQDEDTFDTWASSWIWPFATLGWPVEEAQKSRGFEYWFPTNDLVTGPDIIFFWVARMIIGSLALLGDQSAKTLSLDACKTRLPFKNVYFTGIIRDAKGRKMSKSLGNSPDPLDLIQQYGADGLRFGILNMAPQGQDIFFNETGIALGRNFCNKLWNAARFRFMASDKMDNASLEAILKRMHKGSLSLHDQAILLKLKHLTFDVERLLAQYEFSQMTQAIYSFFWGDYCDWYLEVSKAGLQDEALKGHLLAIQDFILRQVLLLLHPVTPFITEALWHACGYTEKDTDFIQHEMPLAADKIINLLSEYSILLTEEALLQTEELREVVSVARYLKAQYQLQSSKTVRFAFQLQPDMTAIFEKTAPYLLKLIGAAEITVVVESPEGPSGLTPWGTLTLFLDQHINREAERQRLLKEQARLLKAIAAGESKVHSPEFVKKAPPHILEGAKLQLKEAQLQLGEVERLLESLYSHLG